MQTESNNVELSPDRVKRWEWLAVGMALGMALSLGISSLGVPSLWHDELIHTYVAKSIAETGVAQLPSGVPYNNGTTHNHILATMIKVFGMSEVTLRLPSVLLAGLNVLLIYLLARPLLGRETAVVAAVGLALSPWAVAWSREARFYTLQQTLYLVTLIAFWNGMSKNTRKAWMVSGITALTAYALAVLTSYHSILFLGSVGGFAVLMALNERSLKSRWTIVVAVITVVGLVTLASFAGLMNPLDKEAVLDRGGLGGQMADQERAVRGYYFNWLRLNLSTGFFILAFFGFGVMLYRGKREGLYAVLAFWVPMLILTFLIGYRRPRFMFFVYPMYVVAWSYALVWIGGKLRGKEKTALGWTATLIAVVFLIRLAFSFLTLTGDSFEYAQGANTTLARKHPQWRAPSQWVRDNREPDTAILTTTYLPVLYYLGEVDNWYPTRTVWWEVDESGQDDLKTLPDLQAWMVEHPRGYFLSEWWRFDRNRGVTLNGELHDEVIWVMENMQKIEAASNEDITVYSWGLED
jgi:4-amino-4-deoxy-L-arabinose transferase-like glycosyltransferase